MKKVLIITYYFPPYPTIGSIRLKGIAKYLPEFGWHPTILTAKLPGKVEQRYNVVQTPYPGDASAIIKKKMYFSSEKGFQEQIKIPESIRGSKKSISTKIISMIKSIIAYPDEQKKWIPIAIKSGSEILKTNKYNAIISSSSPVSTHIIASNLQNKFNIPWIADLRDLWTQNPYYPFYFYRKIFEKQLELMILKNSNCLVTTSQIWADELSKLHRNKPIHSITNGFDPEHLNLGLDVNNNKFTITYTGQLYQGRRDPELLLKACRELIDKKRIKPSDIRISFYGPEVFWLDKIIHKYKLEHIVKQHGVIKQSESKQKQKNSHLLLMLSWNEPKEKGTYTGKIFEYMASGRPVLGIGGPKGVVSDLLENTKIGHHITNLELLKTILLEYYSEFKLTGNVQFKGIPQEIKRYGHDEMAKKFSTLLNSVSKNTL